MLNLGYYDPLRVDMTDLRTRAIKVLGGKNIQHTDYCPKMQILTSYISKMIVIEISRMSAGSYRGSISDGNGMIRNGKAAVPATTLSVEASSSAKGPPKQYPN
jgi:hypothetical protein